MVHRAEPNITHHALMGALDDVMQRFATMPVVERVAIAAQHLGQLIAEVPDTYAASEVMQTVARNMAQGNADNGGAAALAMMGDGI